MKRRPQPAPQNKRWNLQEQQHEETIDRLYSHSPGFSGPRRRANARTRANANTSARANTGAGAHASRPRVFSACREDLRLQRLEPSRPQDREARRFAFADEGQETGAGRVFRAVVPQLEV